MKLTEHKKARKEFEKSRKIIIKDLQKLEKKYGNSLFRSACHRILTVDSQRKQVEKEIKKRERELDQLKTGKPLTY